MLSESLTGYPRNAHAPEVDVGGGEIAEALVTALVIVGAAFLPR